jgi:DNA-binding MarR family transcriptional regulator
MPAAPKGSRLSHPELLDDLLLYRLGRLVATAGGMVIRLCEGRYGITRREWRVLVLLGQTAGGLLSSELAERIQLDRARTSRAITSLVTKGLIVRQTGQADRRQARVEISAKGRALYESLMPQVQAINQQILSVLGTEEVDGLDDLLTRLQAQSVRLAAQADLPKADRRRGGRDRLPMG